jgi:hypothetical protein
MCAISFVFFFFKTLGNMYVKYNRSRNSIAGERWILQKLEIFDSDSKEVTFREEEIEVFMKVERQQVESEIIINKFQSRISNEFYLQSIFIECIISNSVLANESMQLLKHLVAERAGIIKRQH